LPLNFLVAFLQNEQVLTNQANAAVALADWEIEVRRGIGRMS
jgi:hypothetical protein